MRTTKTAYHIKPNDFFHHYFVLFCLHLKKIEVSDIIDAPAPGNEAEMDEDLFYDSKICIKFSFGQK